MKEEKYPEVESLSYNLLAFFIFIIPVAVWMKLGEPSSSLKIFFMRTGAALFAAQIIIRGYIRLPPKKIFYGLIIYLAASLIPVFYSIHFPTSFIGIYPFYNSSGLSILCLVLFFLLSCSLNKDIFKVLLLISFFVSIYGILQYTGLDFLSWKGDFYPRIFSTLGNPNFLAAYLAILIPVAFTMYLKTGGWAAGFVLILNFVVLILTSSRAGILSGITGAGFTLFILNKDHIIKKRLKNILVCLLLVSFVFCVLNKNIGKRYLSSFNIKESNIASRISQWRTALKMFLEKPFFGWGTNGYYIHFRKHMDRKYLDYTGTLSVPGYPHNCILKILVSGGMLFSVFIIWWWIFIFTYIYKNRFKMNFVASAVMGSLVALGVQNLFSFSVVTTSVIIWSLLGFAVSASGDVKRLKFSSFKPRYILLIPVLWLLAFSYNRLYADYKFYIGDFQEAIKKAPEIQKYGMTYAKLLFMDGEYVEAKEMFKEQIKRNSFSALPYNGFGSVCLQEGDFKKAEFYFKEAIQRDPYLVDAHLKLAGIYRQEHNYENSLKHYLKVLNIKPELINPRYNAGVIYFKQKKFKKALEEWEKVLKYEPDHQMAKNAKSKLKNIEKK